MSTTTAHVLFENPDWLPPLVAGLEAEGFDVQLHEIWQGSIRIDQAPPKGVWINRMSPSSHTRGHAQSVALMREILTWLESHNAPLVNGSAAFRLEVSKLQQDIVLRKHGIKTPRTVGAVGKVALMELAETFTGPFITKHNQGGKGLGIHLFENIESFTAHLESPHFDPGPDHITVLQEYIQPRVPFITRVEILGDRFLYAMRSATSDGFELCPSDACQVPKLTESCPIDGSSKFSVDTEVNEDDPLVQSFIRLCQTEGITVAGIEFVENSDGERFTYDINGTTNYNSGVAKEAGIDGMKELARFLKHLAKTEM